MQGRLERLTPMLGDTLFNSILAGHQYDMSHLDSGLHERIQSGKFDRIVFYGMGCSSVVSDIMKGFFLEKNIPIHVDVVNDYDFEWFISREVLQDDRTLTIIVCYSGWSVEPCLFFEKMRQLTGNKNLLVLSGGGKIASLCLENQTSLILYKLQYADREYPLYHVQQFFSIFLDLFYTLGLTKSSYRGELEECVAFLKKTFNAEKIEQAKTVARRLEGSRVALLATADWYVALLKQTTMFFNEIAMIPTHRNLLHEFSHTEVAAYSDPAQKQAIIVIRDDSADEYTKSKIATMEDLFTRPVAQNNRIEFIVIDLDQTTYLEKFFYGHFFAVYVAYFLGQAEDVSGRDLISIAAQNPWWSQDSIELFPSCVDIPDDLSEQNREVVAAP